MSIFSGLKGFLPKWFRQSASLEVVQLPAHYLTPEHFEAIDTIIKFRKDSITKQGKSFEDLEGDLAILRRGVYGDVFDGNETEVSQKRLLSLGHLKTAPLEEQRDFMRGIYNTLNHGRFDQKPAYAKWVSSGNAHFREMMADVSGALEIVSQHSVDMMATHTMKNPESERSQYIRDTLEINERLAGFVASISKARNELDKGFGRIFKIKSDAMRVAMLPEDEFVLQFQDYIDGLTERLDKIQASQAAPEDQGKWKVRIREAEVLTKRLRERSEPTPTPVPDLAL